MESVFAWKSVSFQRRAPRRRHGDVIVNVQSPFQNVARCSEKIHGLTAELARTMLVRCNICHGIITRSLLQLCEQTEYKHRFNAGNKQNKHNGERALQSEKVQMVISLDSVLEKATSEAVKKSRSDPNLPPDSQYTEHNIIFETE
jgi:hypothetical protein